MGLGFGWTLVWFRGGHGLDLGLGVKFRICLGRSLGFGGHTTKFSFCQNWTGENRHFPDFSVNPLHFLRLYKQPFDKRKLYSKNSENSVIPRTKTTEYLYKRKFCKQSTEVFQEVSHQASPATDLKVSALPGWLRPRLLYLAKIFDNPRKIEFLHNDSSE